MDTFLHLVTVAGFLVIVWYVRQWFRSTIEYKDARRKEIKRRLQVEHKQELAYKDLMAGKLDDAERYKITVKFSDERHKRQMNYIIEDMFERHN